MNELQTPRGARTPSRSARQLRSSCRWFLDSHSRFLEDEHTAAEYLRWVKTRISRVKAETDGLERIRYRVGLANELMNEALPLGLPASNYIESSEKICIQLRVGNQNYDATVTDGRDNSSSVEHIEVTLASDGEEGYLRMRVLHETGEVSGLGTVTKSGTQKTGLTIRVEREMVSQDMYCVERAIS